MKLGEICQKIGSGATPTGGKNSYADSGISLIRSQNVLDFAFSYNGLAHINEEQADKLRNVNVLPEDVLLNITGDSVARVCMVDEAALPARVNQHVAIVRVDKALANPYYVMLWLVWQKNRLLSLASNGATRHALTKEMIRELDLSLPSLNTQTRVSRLLHSLDRKVALNRKKIATLEKMAKEIYDYWFVQYDFPDANGRPYKSSGGEMVYSPELKREIPKGWRVEQIGNHIMSNRGISYSTKDIKTGKGVPMINLNSFNVDSSYKVKGIKTFEGEVPSSKRLSPFDLVMCNTQQTDLDPSKDIIGRTFLIPDIFDSPIVSSHHVTTIHVDDDDLKVFLNALFHTQEFHAYISGYTSGTSIRGLNFSGVENCFMAIPPKRLLSKFAKIGLAGEKKKSLIIRDQEMVQNLRDFLLPLLMNGQVKVG